MANFNKIKYTNNGQAIEGINDYDLLATHGCCLEVNLSVANDDFHPLKINFVDSYEGLEELEYSFLENYNDNPANFPNTSDPTVPTFGSLFDFAQDFLAFLNANWIPFQGASYSTANIPTPSNPNVEIGGNYELLIDVRNLDWTQYYNICPCGSENFLDVRFSEQDIFDPTFNIGSEATFFFVIRGLPEAGTSIRLHCLDGERPILNHYIDGKHYEQKVYVNYNIVESNDPNYRYREDYELKARFESILRDYVSIPELQYFNGTSTTFIPTWKKQYKYVIDSVNCNTNLEGLPSDDPEQEAYIANACCIDGSAELQEYSANQTTEPLFLYSDYGSEDVACLVEGDKLVLYLDTCIVGGTGTSPTQLVINDIPIANTAVDFEGCDNIVKYEIDPLPAPQNGGWNIGVVAGNFFDPLNPFQFRFSEVKFFKDCALTSIGGNCSGGSGELCGYYLYFLNCLGVYQQIPLDCRITEELNVDKSEYFGCSSCGEEENSFYASETTKEITVRTRRYNNTEANQDFWTEVANSTSYLLEYDNQIFNVYLDDINVDITLAQNFFQLEFLFLIDDVRSTTKVFTKYRQLNDIENILN